MLDEDAEYLKSCLSAGLYVWWIDDGGASGHLTLKRIISIGEREDEPGPCGFLGTGIGGMEFVALDNLEVEGVMVTTGCIAKWSKQNGKNAH